MTLKTIHNENPITYSNVFECPRYFELEIVLRIWQQRYKENIICISGTFYCWKYTHKHITANSVDRLSPWPLLLAFEEREERNVCDFDDLETNAGNITDGVALSTESGDQDLKEKQ